MHLRQPVQISLTTNLNWLSQMHQNDQFFLVILTNLKRG